MIWLHTLCRFICSKCEIILSRFTLFIQIRKAEGKKVKGIPKSMWNFLSTNRNLAFTEISLSAKRRKKYCKPMRTIFDIRWGKKLNYKEKCAWSHVKISVSFPSDQIWSSCVCNIIRQLYYHTNRYSKQARGTSKNFILLSKKVNLVKCMQIRYPFDEQKLSKFISCQIV